MRIGGLLAVSFSALAANGCSSGYACTQEARWGVNVRVLDAATEGGRDGGPPACAVQVHATAAGFSEEFPYCYADGPDCRCSGLSEHAGTFTVTVRAAGSVIDTRTVTVRDGRCHVDPVSYSVSGASSGGRTRRTDAGTGNGAMPNADAASRADAANAKGSGGARGATAIDAAMLGAAGSGGSSGAPHCSAAATCADCYACVSRNHVCRCDSTEHYPNCAVAEPTLAACVTSGNAPDACLARLTGDARSVLVAFYACAVGSECAVACSVQPRDAATD